MLPRRLTRATATAVAVLTVAACAGADGSEDGVIRENVVEPGIAAIDEAGALACSADASTLRTALDLYETVEGQPAPDEAALVDAGFLRVESESWDVEDGRLVAQDSACDEAPTTVPAVEIVTESAPETFEPPTSTP